MNIDTLLHPRWVIPVVPEGQVLEHHSIAVHGGEILEILPTTEAKKKYSAAQEHELQSHAIIPGLINAHTHAAMCLFRGMADDLPLMVWLNEHIWPAEKQWISEEFIADGSRLAIAEMLRGGTTCFNDMYFFPNITARVAADAGMRASIGLIMIDFPSAWAADADEYLQRGLEVHDSYRNHHLITTAFAPHAPYSVSDAPLERIRTLADELDIPIHMHLYETEDEVQQSLQTHDCRPLQRLQNLGLLSPSLQAVHMTKIEDNELEMFAQSGAHVVHCPESNQKLANGFCPVNKLIESGINVALGTDGAASNDDLNMFGEMRTASLLAKGISHDPSALPAATALRIATFNGAQALGIADMAGSLEAGKVADLVAVDLGDIETQPVYNPISQLVYATDRSKVTDVWIAGKQVLKGRELTTMNSGEILEAAAKWQKKIATTSD